MKSVGNKIIIRGARVHNLKNVNLDIPRDKLVVITGLSGSGKSSLAFDTIYAEGQRRYIESLSSYARQFLGVMDKPDADKIEGLSPAISIDQKSVSRNPRSTVGTVTEIYDYLRLLFARVGKPHCPECGRPVSKQSPSQIADKIAKWEKRTEFMILAPVIRGKKGEHRALIQEIANAGYQRLRVNGAVMAASEALETKFGRYKIHHIETMIDRMVVEKGLDRTRLVSSIEIALKMGKGLMIAAKKTDGRAAAKSDLAAGGAKNGFEDVLFSEMFSCPDCGINLPEIEPRIFSFNSPYGACSECTGLGSKLEVDPSLVVPNPNLTVAEGAIRPWAGIAGQGWHFWELQKLAESRGFSLNVPFKNLPEKIKDLILFGEPHFAEDSNFAKSSLGKSRGEQNSLGDQVAKAKENGFEGVISNLERRWKETDSDWVRSEMEKYMVVKKCPKCLGRRLNKEALAVTIFKENIVEISGRSVADCRKFFENILASGEFSRSEKKISEPIIKEIIGRLKFLLDVGLDYLTLERESTTLSGGEAQRIRLATQIGSRLVGVLYILDEPSIGLHPRDHQKLIATLKYLRDLGNSVLVVEHDAQTILAADWVVDLGPGAGKYGGEIIFEGTPQRLFKADTLTGDYLSGRKQIELPSYKFSISNSQFSKKTGISNFKIGKYLEIKGASENNLKNINVKIPLGKLVCVSGVSGSGKSSLVYDILAKFLLAKFHHARLVPGKHEKITGVENLNKAIVIDQSPIGRTPRSNPATYTAVFAAIRDIFVKTKEAKARGYGPGRFSFNVKGGRCEACEGQGVKKIEMYFLPDVYVECEECRGRRYNKEVLEIEYKDKNISDVLKMSVIEALKFFENVPAIKQKLQTLNDVGLGYIELGQPATTLSGGEAQRIKLAAELSRRGTGKTLYILDEPTTGLHFDDIKKLLKVLAALVEKENTVLVIEHNLDVVKNADWIIDLGPEGGDKGGYVVAEGTVEEVAKNKKSHTGQFLKMIQKS